MCCYLLLFAVICQVCGLLIGNLLKKLLGNFPEISEKME